MKPETDYLPICYQELILWKKQVQVLKGLEMLAMPMITKSVSPLRMLFGFKSILSMSQKLMKKKVVEKVVENLTINQKMIIELIRKNHQISARELAIELGISHRKTQENRAKLKEIGLLAHIGPAKGGYWEIKQ